VSKRQRDTREHARRAAELRRRVQARRTRMRRAVAANVAVVVVFAGLVVGWLAGVGEDTPAPAPAADDTTTATVVAAVTGVPVAVLDAVGASGVQKVPDAIAGQPALTESGKPLVVYIGAEYCPFCAAQRWPLIQALSRFGTFTGLRTTRSAAGDVHPNTPTFTFSGATYTSDYLSFVGRELYTNERSGKGYTPLDKATPEELALLDRYGGGFPLLLIGGHYVQAGASYKPDVLHDLTWEQIAATMSYPHSPVAQGIDGSANVLTATLCTITKQQPANVCSAPEVRAVTRG